MMVRRASETCMHVAIMYETDMQHCNEPHATHAGIYIEIVARFS